MSTFWLKIAGLAILIIAVFILISVFLGPETETAQEPESKPRTIYEQWEKDEERLRAEPGSEELPKPSSSVQTETKPPTVKPRQPQFEKLSPEQEIEAQRKWEWVVNQRKMARLPIMNPKQMVDTCREIIRRWPNSKYAFLAKRALADLPERYHTMYKITKEEMDVSNFYEKD